MLNIFFASLTSSVILFGFGIIFNYLFLNDEDNHKAFRKMMSEKFYHKDISIRISKYINEASIHFRNESDVAEFLLLVGE